MAPRARSNGNDCDLKILRNAAARLDICCYKRQTLTTVNTHSNATLLHYATTILITLWAPHMAVGCNVPSNAR